MSTSTVEKSGLWISLSSLFRSVTSSTHKQNLSDKGRRKFIARTVVDNEELPELPDDPEEKAVRPVVFVGHPRPGMLGVFRGCSSNQLQTLTPLFCWDCRTNRCCHGVARKAARHRARLLVYIVLTYSNRR